MDNLKGRSDFTELRGDRYDTIVSEDYNNAIQRYRKQTPEAREKRRAYRKEYENRPEVRARKLAKKRERNKTPEAKFKRSIYLSDYSNRPHVVAKRKEYYSREEVISRHRETIRLKTQKTRVEVLMSYGGKCSCCGEGRIEFLAIDHINGGGNAERSKYRGSSWYFYLKKNHPEHVRILCHNCNMSVGLYGYCPHSKEGEEIVP
jgi:hypothetical protein